MSACGIWVRWSAIFIESVAKKSSIHLETKRVFSWLLCLWFFRLRIFGLLCVLLVHCARRTFSAASAVKLMKVGVFVHNSIKKGTTIQAPPSPPGGLQWKQARWRRKSVLLTLQRRSNPPPCLFLRMSPCQQALPTTVASKLFNAIRRHYCCFNLPVGTVKQEPKKITYPAYKDPFTYI